KPKPLCSVSKSTKSQPADFMMCPMPGVANSTMKWPTFSFSVPASAFSAVFAIPSPPPDRRCTRHSFYSAAAGRSAVGPRILELPERDDLRRHERRAVAVERREVRRLLVRVERRGIVIDLVQEDAVGVALRDHDVELPAPWFVTDRRPGVFHDESAEMLGRSGLQPELHHDDVASHAPLPGFSSTFLRLDRGVRG